MPVARIKPSLAYLVDSDLEEETSELSIIAKPVVTSTKMPAARKGRGRPANANKVTKPAQKSTRRASGRLATAASKSDDLVEILADKSNNQTVRAPRKGRKVVDEDDIAMETVEKPKATRGRRAAAAPAEHTEEPVPKPKGRPGRKVVPTEAEIPETQAPEQMDLDDEEQDQLEHLPVQNSSASVQPLPAHTAIPSNARSQRVVEVDMSDSSVRRRLGELTRKYDSLEAKYRNLQELGTKEAEKNFDRLKKQTDQRAQTAKQLIADLKAELSEQTAIAKDGQKLHKQIDQHESTISELQKKVAELTTSLAESRTENKALQTKLAASRSAEASLAKIPGSAIKGNAMGSQTAAKTDAIQAAQMKEDLYSDLTGLIVTGVKFQDKEDIFDCLQTGRNGTLHFKLSIETDMTGDGYDEAQVTYRPQLNPSRDRALIDILPDYLVEDITFPRPHAAKFYSRVSKALTERLE